MDMLIPFSTTFAIIMGVILLAYLALKQPLIKGRIWAFLVIAALFVSMVSYSGASYFEERRVVKIYDDTSVVNSTISTSWIKNVEEVFDRSFESISISKIVSDDERIYVSCICLIDESSYTGVCCLSGEDGTVIWSAFLDRPAILLPSGNMIMHQDNLYVVSGQSKLFCLDKLTGNIVWKSDYEAGFQYLSIARCTENSILCSGQSLSEYDIETGDLLHNESGLYGLYGMHGNNVLTCNSPEPRQITCMNYATKDIVWELAFNTSINVVFNDERDLIVVLCHGYNISCYETDTGKRLWSCPFSSSIYQVTPLVIGNLVYYGYDNLHAKELSDGQDVLNVSWSDRIDSLIAYSEDSLIIEQGGDICLYSLKDNSLKWRYNLYYNGYSMNAAICDYPRIIIPLGPTILTFDRISDPDMRVFFRPQDIHWNLVRGDESDRNLDIKYSFSFHNTNGFETTPESYYYLITMRRNNEIMFDDVKIPVSRDGLNVIEKVERTRFDGGTTYNHFTYDIRLYCGDDLLQNEVGTYTIEMWHPGGCHEVYTDICSVSLILLSILAVPWIVLDFIKSRDRFLQERGLPPK